MKPTRRLFWFMVAAVAVGALAGGFYGQRLRANPAGGDDSDVQANLNNFTKIYNLVEHEYADKVDPNKAIYKATAENVASQWQTNLGIHVNLQPIDHAAFIKNYTAHNYVLFREGWQADYDHPQDWFDNLFIKGGGSNGGDYTDPKVEALVKKADAEPLDAAIADYNAASKQMMTDAAYAPLAYFKGEFMFKPYLIHAGSNNFNDFYWNEMQIGSH